MLIKSLIHYLKRFLNLNFDQKFVFRIKYNFKYSKLLKRKLVEEIIIKMSSFTIAVQNILLTLKFKRFTDKINKFLSSWIRFSTTWWQTSWPWEKKIKIENVFPILFSKSKYEKNRYFQYYDYATENNHLVLGTQNFKNG